MYNQKKVFIQRDSQITECSIEFSTTPPWELRLLGETNGVVEYSCKGEDLFDCLTELRLQNLEKRGSLILCNGARFDVYPSRMSRQMSGGRKAYIMRIGQPSRRTDLVDIFDPVEDFSSVATVAEQKDFYKKWLNSL